MLLHQGSDLDFVYLMTFSALFIVQAVGHRVGDYLLQTHTMATQKTTDTMALIAHCTVYSATVAFFSMLIVPPLIAAFIFVITYVEHVIVDTRQPVIGFKNFFERTIGGNKEFNAEDLPFFVLIEIDQTIHYLRILVISLVFANILT